MTDHVFEIVQDGMVVAKAISPKRTIAYREAMHYAMVYRQDGPVKLIEIGPKNALASRLNFRMRRVEGQFANKRTGN